MKQKQNKHTHTYTHKHTHDILSPWTHSTGDYKHLGMGNLQHWHPHNLWELYPVCEKPVCHSKSMHIYEIWKKQHSIFCCAIAKTISQFLSLFMDTGHQYEPANGWQSNFWMMFLVTRGQFWPRHHDRSSKVSAERNITANDQCWNLIKQLNPNPWHHPWFFIKDQFNRLSVLLWLFGFHFQLGANMFEPCMQTVKSNSYTVVVVFLFKHVKFG